MMSVNMPDDMQGYTAHESVRCGVKTYTSDDMSEDVSDGLRKTCFAGPIDHAQMNCLLSPVCRYRRISYVGIPRLLYLSGSMLVLVHFIGCMEASPISQGHWSQRTAPEAS